MVGNATHTDGWQRLLFSAKGATARTADEPDCYGDDGNNHPGPGIIANTFTCGGKGPDREHGGGHDAT
jgi:hypothetical protein